MSEGVNAENEQRVYGIVYQADDSDPKTHSDQTCAQWRAAYPRIFNGNFV